MRYEREAVSVEVLTNGTVEVGDAEGAIHLDADAARWLQAVALPPAIAVLYSGNPNPKEAA